MLEWLNTHFPPALLDLFARSFVETLIMVGISGLAGALIGVPLGVLLRLTDRGGILENALFNRTVGTLVNAVRSTPFIILLVAIIPFTRLITGSSIGTAAAVVPLTIAAAPFVARLVEASLREVDAGLIEAAQGRHQYPDRVQGAAARGSARHRGRSHHHAREPDRLLGHGGRDWRRRTG